MSVQHLFVAYIPDGGLPLFTFPGLTLYYTPDQEMFQERYPLEEPCWSICPTLRDRVLVNLDLDTRLSLFKQRIPIALRPILERDDPGTWVFAMRSWFEIDQEVFIVAGLIFLQDVVAGPPIGSESSLSSLLIQAVEHCPMARPQPEVPPSHPAIQEALGRDYASYAGYGPSINQEAREDLATRLEYLFSQEQHSRSENLQQKARHRALQLLREGLSEHQREELDSSGGFHVLGADGKEYFINKRYGHNVWLIEEEMGVKVFCAVTQDYVPEHDLMLAQKLYLEHTPEVFLDTANLQVTHNGFRMAAARQLRQFA